MYMSEKPEILVKQPSEKPSRLPVGKRLKNRLLGAAAGITMLLEQRQSKFFTSHGGLIEERHDMPRDSKRRLKSNILGENTSNSDLYDIKVNNKRITETLQINKRPVSASVKRTQTNDVLNIDFDDGSSLNIILDKGSIRRISVGFTDSVCSQTVSMDDLERVMQECDVVEVCSPSGDGRRKPRFNYQTPDELVFRRSDGTQLVIELNPGTIQSITFYKK